METEKVSAVTSQKKKKEKKNMMKVYIETHSFSDVFF